MQPMGDIVMAEPQPAAKRRFRKRWILYALFGGMTWYMYSNATGPAPVEVLMGYLHPHWRKSKPLPPVSHNPTHPPSAPEQNASVCGRAYRMR
jgi:hypothetical protein